MAFVCGTVGGEEGLGMVGHQENPGNFAIFVSHVLRLGKMVSILFSFLLQGNSLPFLCPKQPEWLMCVEKGLKIEYTGWY